MTLYRAIVLYIQLQSCTHTAIALLYLKSTAAELIKSYELYHRVRNVKIEVPPMGYLTLVACLPY